MDILLILLEMTDHFVNERGGGKRPPIGRHIRRLKFSRKGNREKK
jgi:hypothetical protein